MRSRLIDTFDIFISSDVSLMDKELKNYAIFLEQLKTSSEFPPNFEKYKGRFLEFHNVFINLSCNTSQDSLYIKC